MDKAAMILVEFLRALVQAPVEKRQELLDGLTAAMQARGLSEAGASDLRAVMDRLADEDHLPLGYTVDGA